MNPQPDNRNEHTPLPNNNNWVAYIPDEEWLALDCAIHKMEEVRERLREWRVES